MVCRNGLTMAPDFLVAGDFTGLTSGQVLYGASDGSIAQSAGLTYDGTYLTATFKDTTFSIVDNSDPTKIANFQCSGITAGNTRTFTFPDGSATLAGLELGNVFTAKQFITLSGTISIDLTYTGASGSSSTSNLRLITDDGATMASGDLLGGQIYSGVRSTGPIVYNNSVRLRAYTTEAWSSTACGSRWVVETVPNTTTSPQPGISVGQDQSLSVFGTTASVSTATGSLINGGGFGNAGAAYIGGILDVVGTAALRGIGKIGTQDGGHYIGVARNASGDKFAYFNAGIGADGVSQASTGIKMAVRNSSNAQVIAQTLTEDGEVRIGTTTSGGSSELMTIGLEANTASAVFYRRNATTIGGFGSANSVFSLFGGTTIASHLTLDASGNVGISGITTITNASRPLEVDRTTAGTLSLIAFKQSGTIFGGIGVASSQATLLGSGLSNSAATWDNAQNFQAGGGALGTTSTDGFLYVPSCAGTPTGVPTAKTGFVPLVVDTTNNKFYFRSGGAWRDAGP